MPPEPPPPVVPPELARLTPGWEPVLAYRLVPGLTTWRLTGPGGAVRYAKVDATGHSRFPTLRGEARRMRWAASYLPVPTVVALEQLGTTTVLVTEALGGLDGTHARWRGDLPGLVTALATGLRTFHDATHAGSCPFSFDLAHALGHVRRRVASGAVDPGGFHGEHAHLTPAAALRQLEDTAPDHEDLVVCHGDYCPPNVLLTEDPVPGYQVCGYVDLGELGVADRWWDVAVGAWSAGWNFGPELEPLFYEGYGIAPDGDRIRFYRLLYDLVS